MLTDCAEDASIAMCENANASAKIHEISVLYGFRFFNYSTSFSKDDFSSFTNWTKEARLLRSAKK